MPGFQRKQLAGVLLSILQEKTLIIGSVYLDDSSHTLNYGYVRNCVLLLLFRIQVSCICWKCFSIEQSIDPCVSAEQSCKIPLGSSRSHLWPSSCVNKTQALWVNKAKCPVHADSTFAEQSRCNRAFEELNLRAFQSKLIYSAVGDLLC